MEIGSGARHERVMRQDAACNQDVTTVLRSLLAWGDRYSASLMTLGRRIWPTYSWEMMADVEREALPKG